MYMCSAECSGTETPHICADLARDHCPAQMTTISAFDIALIGLEPP
jgi:hypothetical protein